MPEQYPDVEELQKMIEQTINKNETIDIKEQKKEVINNSEIFKQKIMEYQKERDELFEKGQHALHENVKLRQEIVEKDRIINILLAAVKDAYKKHVNECDDIGWNELGDTLLNAICEAIGDEAFIKWNSSN